MSNPEAMNYKQNKPTFSIVIPTFNRAELLPRAIQSVLNQTFADFELIVVDDGSTDDTELAVQALADPRLCYFRQTNQGRSAARNAGAAQANGQFVTFLDSDDETDPEWLAHFAEAFQKPETGIVCCGITDIKERPYLPQPIVRVTLPRSLGPMLGEEQGLFLAGAFAVRRNLFRQVGGYVDQLAYSENTELALRLVPYCLESGWKIATVAKPLLTFYNQRSFGGPDTFQARLAGTRYILNHYRDKLWAKDRPGLAQYASIAGVNAARLGRYREARRFFAIAVRAAPWRWKHYGQLLLALVPGIRRKFWLRYA